MPEKSVIIIGAGLAGLSTGCYAQMNGHKSRIFEHRAVPGGVAAAWKREGYIIDGGIHFVMGHRPGTALHELYCQLGVGQKDRFVEMTTYGRFIDEARGRSVMVTGDLNRLADDLNALSPMDATAIDEFIAGARAMRGFDMSEVGMSKPPELASPMDQLKAMWQMRRVLKYFGGKYARPVTDYVSNFREPLLQECIKSVFLPDVPVWFVFMLLGLLADGQLGLLKGGCLDFVLPVEKRYKELGGQVNYTATVEEILLEGDRAVGIRLADGSEHHSDVVVSAADGHSTIFKMLGGRYVNKKIKSRYQSWRLCRPLVMVSYGVARDFPEEPPLTVIMLEHPLTVGCQTIGAFMVRIMNYSSKFAPPGKTLVQIEFETDWDYWNDLQTEDRSRYDAEKEWVAAEALRRLEAHYPGISSQVEVTDVATPYTTWRYTLNRRGAWGGWLLVPEVANVQVERTLPGLADFYMAGQWVMPGGGVPPCLYSGRHVVQILCHRDGRHFTAALP
ncbi:MAG: NAD(P)/FAD-dependent oxidoreductase [Chloroflexota bacterium]